MKIIRHTRQRQQWNESRRTSTIWFASLPAVIPIAVMIAIALYSTSCVGHLMDRGFAPNVDIIPSSMVDFVRDGSPK